MKLTNSLFLEKVVKGMEERYLKIEKPQKILTYCCFFEKNWYNNISKNKFNVRKDDIDVKESCYFGKWRRRFRF